MSKGPGRIERAIIAIFDSEPDNAFAIEELCQRVYPGINRVERKHRVSVLRAVRNPRKCGSTIDAWRTWGQGEPVISYATARMMDMGTDRYIPKAKLRARIAEGGDHHHYVVEGGIWWIHTQLAIAKRTGDTTRLKRLEREKEKHEAKIMKDLGKTIRR